MAVFSSIDAQWAGLVVAVLAGTGLMMLLLGHWHRPESLGSSLELPLPNSATREVCASLRSQFPDITHTREDVEFGKHLQSYWSAQARVPKPALVVKPRNVNEVSNILRILAEAVKSSTHDEPVRFAIKSGGHNPELGFANVESGVVVDLGDLKAIELSEDHQLAIIEPGTTWGTVYRKLEKYGLAVAGGRASSVGVGGLILGGGLSFFSPQVGFVCDTVVEFEVVLADGRVVTANDTSHSDLAVALRGGGNNFGIVTKFITRTFPQQQVWMGHCFHWPSAAERLFQAYYDLGELRPFDKKATCIFLLCWTKWLPFILPITCLNYAEPTANPSVFRRFFEEKRFWNTLAIRPLVKATDRIEDMSPANKQDLFHTITFENDLETLQFAHLAFRDSIADIKKVSGMVWSVVFQPLVPSATVHHASNAMGINTDRTLTVMHVNVVWDFSKDDVLVQKSAQSLADRVESFARQKGVYHSYKYANYCSAVQNPYAGYGIERHDFLREMSRKYDPDQIFQRGVPGLKL